MLRSENVRDHEVVGEAGEGLARVSRVGRVSIAALASFSFARELCYRSLRWKSGWFCVRVVRVAVPRGFLDCAFSKFSASQNKKKVARCTLFDGENSHLGCFRRWRLLMRSKTLWTNHNLNAMFQKLS